MKFNLSISSNEAFFNFFLDAFYELFIIFFILKNLFRLFSLVKNNLREDISFAIILNTIRHAFKFMNIPQFSQLEREISHKKVNSFQRISLNLWSFRYHTINHIIILQINLRHLPIVLSSLQFLLKIPLLFILKPQIHPRYLLRPSSLPPNLKPRLLLQPFQHLTPKKS